MKLAESIAQELKAEAVSTRKMLERVPLDKGDWKPHGKSTSLVRLAGHIAELPRMVVVSLTKDELDLSNAGFKPFMPTTTAELLKTFDEHVARAVEVLPRQSDEDLDKRWRLRIGERVLFEAPRIAVLRNMAINHIIHHRGQLSVYLRLLDVPVPSVYGPTADEPIT